jgi:hypothetical protein
MDIVMNGRFTQISFLTFPHSSTSFPITSSSSLSSFIMPFPWMSWTILKNVIIFSNCHCRPPQFTPSFHHHHYQQKSCYHLQKKREKSENDQKQCEGKITKENNLIMFFPLSIVSLSDISVTSLSSSNDSKNIHKKRLRNIFFDDGT